MPSKLVGLIVVWATLVLALPAHAELLKVTARDASGGYPEAVCVYYDSRVQLTDASVKLDELLSRAKKQLKSENLYCQCNALGGKCNNAKGLPAEVRDILFIQVFPTPTRIALVSLDGPQLHINATFGSAPAWLVSRSSNYLPASAPVSRKDQVLGSFVELPLVSAKVSLALPEADLEGFESVLEVNGTPVRQTQAPGGNVTFALPVDGIVSGEQVALTVKVRPKNDLTKTTAQYVAHLPSPQRLVPVRAERFVFRWRARECLYQPHRLQDCPNAAVPEHGIECTPRFDARTLACQYFCAHSPQSQADGRLSSYAIPAQVRMSIGVQDDAWVEHVVRLNQLVSGGPSRDTRRLAVLFPWETNPAKASKPRAQKLVHADLFAPDGRTFRIEADAGNQKVTVPGATCNDQLTYRYWGRWQNFDSGQVPLDSDGRYVLPNPKDTFHENWLVTHVSLAFSSASFERETPIHPALDVESAAQVRWFESRHVFEVPLGYELGMRDYVLYTTSQKPREEKTNFVHRVSLGARWMYGASEAFWLGAGLGGRLSWVVDEHDAAHIDSPAFSAYISPVIVRVVPTRALSFQFVWRMFVPETVRFFDDNLSSTYDTRSKVGMVFMGGVGFLLPM